MQAKKRILLIQHHSPRINFTLPLGLAYIAAVIKRKGLIVKVIDATAPYTHGNLRYILKEVNSFKPDIVGLSLTTLFVGFAYDLVEELKKLNTTIIAGGPHVTLFPHEVLSRGVDIAVRGEAEITIEELIDHFQDKISLKDIKGISFFDGAGQIIDNPDRALIADLDMLPFPAKETFDIAAYARNDSELWRYKGLMTSRGCIYTCNYCSKGVFGDRYRRRSIDNVMDEVIFLNQQYGLKNFYFLDDIFTADKKRTFLLCDELRKRLNFDFSFSCVTRLDRIDKELLKKLKETGCWAINYGVESANPATLEKLDKHNTIAEMVDKIHLTKESGINCTVNFMWGYPWEGESEIKNTISLIKKLSTQVLEVMPAGMLIPFPGTQIYEQYKKEYNFQDWWLKRAEYTGRYRRDSRVSLHRYFLFDDQGQFQGGGFFNKSQKELKLIKYAAKYIGWHNLKTRHHVFLTLVYALLCKVSQILYNLCPPIDYFYSRIIFRLIGFKNRALFKKKTLNKLKGQILADRIDAHHLDYYSDISDEYDYSRFGHKSGQIFNEMEKSLIRRMLGNDISGKLLDVATGTARIAFSLSKEGLDIIGVDQSFDMLKQAQDKRKETVLPARVEFLTGGARRLPFKDNTFDAVISIRFLTGIPPEALCFYIDEMKRVLKPGGTLLLEFNNKLDLRELVRMKNRRRFPWPWQIEELFVDLDIVDRKAFWFAGQRRIAALSEKLSYMLGKLGRVPPFYYLASQVIIKAEKPAKPKVQSFQDRKEELLKILKLEQLKILRSRIHCEVIKCETQDGSLVVLKILKRMNPKNKREFDKEVELIKNYKPQAPLRFPELVSLGEDYCVTKFAGSSRIDFSQIGQAQVDLIVESLNSLHKLKINNKDKDATWNPGFGYQYYLRLPFWLLYLMWDYIGIRNTFTFFILLVFNFKHVKKYKTVLHGSLEIENMLFDPENKFLVLFDFEYFSLTGNFLFDICMLACDSEEPVRNWSWQKMLFKRYLTLMKTKEDFNLEKKEIMACMQIALLHIFIRRMIVRRSHDERDRFFSGMSPGFILSRILLKVYRLFGGKPVEFSESMRVLEDNFDRVINNDSFEKLYNRIME